MKSKETVTGPSSAAGSTKRVSTEALDESPTAKRAKRVKRGKKRRSKAGQDSDGYVSQEDWVGFDGISPTIKETPIKPPTPFPSMLANRTNVLKSAEKPKAEANGEANELKANKGSNENKEKQNTPKTAANTAKTRADRDSVGSLKQQTEKNGLKATPTLTLEPPKPEAEKKSPAVPAASVAPNPKSISSPGSKITDSEKVPTNINGVTPTPNDAETDPIPLTSAPTGTKTLKFINKHLKSLEAKITTLTTSAATDAVSSNNSANDLRTDLTKLHQRLDAAEQRAAVRHEMLFNALVKVAGGVARVGEQVGVLQQLHQQAQQVQKDGQGQGGDEAGAGAKSPSASVDEEAASIAAAATARNKHSASMKQSRKTLEQFLRIQTENMNRAGAAEDVAKFGELCVQFAGDLFKTLG